MKQYDTALAQTGDMVFAKLGGSSTPARYLAMMEDGRHVIELTAVSGVHFVQVAEAHQLFAPPRKRTVWINLHKQRETGEITPYLYDDEAWAHSQRSHSMNCLGSFPIEIEE